MLLSRCKKGRGEVEMLEWVSDNGAALSVASNFGMLIVWVVYLGTFLRQYRRQTQPKIVINRAAGRSLDAECFISNMSTEPIYVEAIIVSFETEGKCWSATVTDIVRRDGEDIPDDPRQRTRQGPMRSGDYMPVGSFNGLLERFVEESPDLEAIDNDDFEKASLRVKILADYASEELVIGAERVFDFAQDGSDWFLRSGTSTHQIRSRRQRRRAQEQVLG